MLSLTERTSFFNVLGTVVGVHISVLLNLEKASASNQSSKEFEPGRTEWDISISHLVVANSEYEGMLKVGTKLSISVVINGVRKTGMAICQHADIGGTAGNLATGSLKLKGSGPLT